jgi:hypothetical protein
MTEPAVTIRLDGNGRIHQPGETLAGEYRLQDIQPEQLSAVEVSVVWYTDGKGDSDMAVHYFRRLSVVDGDPLDPRQPGRFSTVLPNSPLSYEGAILKLRWCVRVRAFLAQGKELLQEQPFRLGSVPSVPVDAT